MDRDCSEIIVRINLDRPSVAVFTADGRHAVRPLRNADDLRPTVQGLIVTVLPAEKAAQDPTAAEKPTDPPESTSSPSKMHLLLTAAGGGRLSFPGTLAAAVVEATGGLTIHRWELGMFGSYSPGLPSSWGATNFTQSSFEMGASAGRRHRWRFADLIVGVRAGAIRTSTPTAYRPNCDGINVGPECSDPIGVASARYLPSVGALAAMALWPTSFIRFRPQFLFEWLPTTARFLGGSPSSGTAIPGWSLTLSLGAESGVL
jgi:hypothetical protein